MKTDNRHYIQTLLGVRRNAIEIIAIAVVIAFGVNLAASGLITLLSMPAVLSSGLGAVLTLIGVAYLGIRLKPMSSRELILDGVLPITAERNIHEIKRYELSERLHSYFVGLTSENKAIAKLWRESEFGAQLSEEGGTARLARSQGNALVQEALEYFVLDKLSLHLSEYFDSEREVEEHSIVRVQRSDIPHILLENRFLELFCKPMQMREAFMESGASHNDHNVVYATGKDGAFFDRFELILPKGSTLFRSNRTGLQISTSRFTLTVKPEFHGYATVFPNMFDELYLGKKFDEVEPYIVRIRLHIKFRWWAFFTGTGWDYYEWLDSFLDELTDAFSFDDFVASIGWHTAVSSAIAIKHLTRTEAK